MAVNKIAANLAAFRAAVEHHDRANSHGSAFGIGVSHFDLERLGFEDGEELWSGVTIINDGKSTGTFRILCNGQHGGDELVEEDTQITNAVGAYE